MSDNHDNKPHVLSIGAYAGVLTALLVLTAITAWIAFQDLGRLNTFAAVGIAIFKTFLVCAIFMHLKWSPKLLWLIAGAGGIFFIIMVTFTLADFDAQGRRPIASTWVVNGQHYPDSTAPYHHGTESAGGHAAPELTSPTEKAPAPETPAHH